MMIPRISGYTPASYNTPTKQVMSAQSFSGNRVNAYKMIDTFSKELAEKYNHEYFRKETNKCNKKLLGMFFDDEKRYINITNLDSLYYKVNDIQGDLISMREYLKKPPYGKSIARDLIKEYITVTKELIRLIDKQYNNGELTKKESADVRYYNNEKYRLRKKFFNGTMFQENSHFNPQLP